MSDLEHVIYISSAARTLGDTDLERLLLDARAFNATVGVTGVLLFNGAAFFQYFEGPAAACARVYDRIRASSVHHTIVELGHAGIDDRQFASWHMGCTTISRSQWLELSKADWLTAARDAVGTARRESEGVRLLNAFWQAAVSAH
jgi:hypothetical protein